MIRSKIRLPTLFGGQLGRAGDTSWHMTKRGPLRFLNDRSSCLVIFRIPIYLPEIVKLCLSQDILHT